MLLQRGAFFLGVVVCWVFAEKILIYDEERGIISVDKEEQDKAASKKREDQQKKSPDAAIDHQQAKSRLDGAIVDASIQKGRPKDPPEVYFKSGLQYFKSDNFEDALKNFTHADSLDPQPKYVLWMGKTLRQLHKFDKLLFFMDKIVTMYPESDVADDALFETAFCHQINNNYDKAIKTYTKLAEQYPFGMSYSNGESFRELAYKQCQLMRAEMVSILKVLGYGGDDIATLYCAFQKSRNLPVNGTGDAETIRAIKTAYNEYLEKESAKALRQKREERNRVIGLAVCAVLLINSLGLVLFNRKIARLRKRLAAIDQSLSDLSMDAS